MKMCKSTSKSQKLFTIEFLNDATKQFENMIDTLAYNEWQLALCPDEITCMKADLIKLCKKYEKMLGRYL